ncbi:hypothetical protein M0D21_15955 [Aquimarina sp. D1M17]|uniref:hypothetical protein n=1 Tax=Aquimarina acroporae TaxID=2937283 RepID=UPI0020C10F30|nr:hypothetical protein [Aquimarina acroporae]MCK8523072.1 hypothetical protein [Aquimarina acroporae]
MNNNLELLSSALRTVGGNFDIPTLDLILSVKDLVDAKGTDVSIGEIGAVSNAIAEKYKLNQ